MTINFGSLGLVVKCWTVAPGSGHRNLFLFQGGLSPSPKIEEKVVFVFVVSSPGCGANGEHLPPGASRPGHFL